MTNLEGRVLLRQRAAAPPPGVRTDLEVIAALARLLDAPGQWDAEPEAVFDELRRASAGGPADYAGISYERIAAEDGVFWPCPAADHPGTPRMFLDRFATPDGRARFVPVEHRPAAEDLDAEYPVYLTTGRLLQHYQSGAQTRRVRALREAQPEPFVEMHPDLAAAHELAEGDRIRVVSRRGAARGTGAHHRDDPRRHRVHAVPLGRRGLGQPGHEPRARPGLEDAGVQGVRGAAGGGQVTRAAWPSSSGTAWPASASCRNCSRMTRPAFAITVVGDEPGGAYNRVLLPNVLAGAAGAASIELAGADWYAARGVTLRAGVAAVRIDREQRLRAPVQTVRRAATTCWCSRPAAARCCRRPPGWPTARAAGAGRGRVPYARRLRRRSRRSPRRRGARPCSAAACSGLETARGAGRPRAAGHAGPARAAADGTPARRGRFARAGPHRCDRSA